MQSTFGITYVRTRTYHGPLAISEDPTILALQLILLGLFGAAIGGQLNRAIYRWAWKQRSISPWSAPPIGVEARSWADCLPVVGWWGLRRESKTHGTAFWVRPMAIEISAGIGLAALYWWVVIQGSQLHPNAPLAAAVQSSLIQTFVANAILFALMIVATFIDFDEKTIPDYITVPGTWIALIFAAALPHSLLPVAPTVDPILLTSPNPWLLELNGSMGLGIGLCCWLGWCFALLDKTVYLRRGIVKGIQFFCARIRRSLRPWFIAMGVIGCVFICTVWSSQGQRWETLLSSLVGLAFGGGLVWAIRIVSGYVLRMEAMGFGDVTLMAMIGAFLGWEAAMMTFFLAPFTSIVIALTQWIMTGNKYIPFGPFLCAAASIVIIFWGSIWANWSRYFELGLLIPGILVVAVALMGIMLAILQVIKRLLGISTMEMAE